ncbi:MAG: sugar phosphate nucleotidyltransferase [Polyangiaceae bacterium]
MDSKSLSRYQVVLLCGGQGTRIRAVAEDRPKPMVEVGEKPILWHVMKIYSQFGLRRFILALGHQGEKIVEYFENYRSHNHDFTLRLNDPADRTFHRSELPTDTDVEDWEITFAHTGTETMTGGRLSRVRRYIDQDHFFATYGDGVANVDIPHVFSHHREAGNIATLVGVHLPTTFGIVESNDQGQIHSFREKPALPGYVNGGFFCFTREIFDYIQGDSTVLEDEPLRSLASRGRLGMVPHPGFWHAMDHFKDYTALNEMWKRKAAPWKTW